KIHGANTKNTQEHYDAAGRLTAMQGPQGHQTTIEYTGERASSILTKTSTGTEKTALIYNAQGLIAQLETQSGATQAGKSSANTRVYYGYDANKRLSSVKVDLTPADNSIADGKVYETRYTYDGNSNRVQSVSQSDGTVLTIGYEEHNGDHRVKSLTDGEGNQTLYNYVSATHTRVTIGGAQVDYHFDAEKRLTSVERVDNHQIVKQEYGYNTAGRLHSVINGLGHQTQYGYDSEGNLTQETDADGVTITRAYNSNNQLIKEQIGTDSTVYVYDTQQRLRFKLDAENRLVEYRYNTLGQRVSLHQYTDATYSRSVHSVAALEGFAASQKAHQQRSDYGYDFRGQLNSVSR
ncbi:RHS repeat protein, partial [Pseudoalteromonas sp. MMG012]|uniref:RHS repeat protein n=1 Tax=Pseudoalteromonas sp. MMG012 TaxID=2822686 RepID=UPI001B3A3902